MELFISNIQKQQNEWKTSTNTGYNVHAPDVARRVAKPLAVIAKRHRIQSNNKIKIE